MGSVSESSSESMLASAVIEGQSSVPGGTSESVWDGADSLMEVGGVSSHCLAWSFPPGGGGPPPDLVRSFPSSRAISSRIRYSSGLGFMKDGDSSVLGWRYSQELTRQRSTSVLEWGEELCFERLGSWEPPAHM